MVVRDNVVGHSSWKGIATSWTTGVIIEDNTVHDIGEHGESLCHLKHGRNMPRETF